jgi:hypothetical protein
MKKDVTKLDPKVKNSYWKVVQDCLVEILGFSRREANSMGKDLRRKIDEAPGEISKDLFYHNEPFDIACDLARRKIECSDCQEKYESILKRHSVHRT